jgi:hypothetical protein
MFELGRAIVHERVDHRVTFKWGGRNTVRLCRGAAFSATAQFTQIRHENHREEEASDGHDQTQEVQRFALMERWHRSIDVGCRHPHSAALRAGSRASQVTYVYHVAIGFILRYKNRLAVRRAESRGMGAITQ